MLQYSIQNQPFTQEASSHQHCRQAETIANTRANPLHPRCDAFSCGNNPSRSRSGRKLRKVKTPSEALKENILKCRQGKKIADLKSITEQNFRLFCRLQEQRSAYEFETLHRESACSSIQLSRSSSSSKINPIYSQHLGEGFKNRCGSSATLQKSHLQLPNQENASPAAMTSARQSFKKNPPPKTSSITPKDNKQNRVQNARRRSKLSAGQQEQLLAKKLCLRLPLGGLKMEQKRNLIQQGLDVDLPLSFRPATACRESKKGFLTERKLHLNL